jgi:DNA invertase Pin-like site-specific DNA recombinase
MSTDGGRLAAVGYVSGIAAARLDDAELRAQRSALERHCADRGWDLLTVVIEPRLVRGTRPALAYALERLADGGASCLIVTDLGRLYRSVAELRTIFHELEHADARLVSLQPPIDTGTAFGRQVVQILCSISDWEHNRAAERSRKALDAARSKGTIQPAIPPELKRRIRRMRRAGMTLQAIVDELNEAGVPTVRGGAQWRVSSVQAAIGYKRPDRHAPGTDGRPPQAAAS